MAEQTFDLGEWTSAGWVGGLLIDSGLIAGGVVGYLRTISEVVGFAAVGIDPTVDGPSSRVDLTTMVEQYIEAFQFTSSNGSIITLPGPTNSTNLVSDGGGREPYQWQPNNSVAWSTWAADAVGTTVTLRLTDGILNPEQDGDATPVSWVIAIPAAQGTIVVSGDAEAAEWTVDVPAAQGLGQSFGIGNFDTSPYGGVYVLALMETAISGEDLVTNPATPIEGELDVASDVTITRIFNRLGEDPPRVTLRNDLGAGGFDEYWDATDADPLDIQAKLFMVTPAGTIPFSYGNAGGRFSHWYIDDITQVSLINGLVDGDRFVFAIVLPVYTGDGEASNWDFDVPNALGQVGVAGNAEPTTWEMVVLEAMGQVVDIITGTASPVSWAVVIPAAQGLTVPPGMGVAANWEFNVPAAQGLGSQAPDLIGVLLLRKTITGVRLQAEGDNTVELRQRLLRRSGAADVAFEAIARVLRQAGAGRAQVGVRFFDGGSSVGATLTRTWDTVGDWAERTRVVSVPAGVDEVEFFLRADGVAVGDVIEAYVTGCRLEFTDQLVAARERATANYSVAR